MVAHDGGERRLERGGERDAVSHDFVGRRSKRVGVGLPIEQLGLLLRSRHSLQGADDVVDLQHRNAQLTGERIGEGAFAGTRRAADEKHIPSPLGHGDQANGYGSVRVVSRCGRRRWVVTGRRSRHATMSA